MQVQQSSSLGDCWLLSVINVLLHRNPNFLERIVRPLPDGRWEVLLRGCRFILNGTVGGGVDPRNGRASLLCAILEKGVACWLSLNPTKRSLHKRRVAGVSPTGIWYPGDLHCGLVETACDLLIGPNAYILKRCVLGDCRPDDFVLILSYVIDNWHVAAYHPTMCMSLSTAVISIRLTSQALALLS